MSWIETLGQQAGSSAVGAGMGLILGEYNDRRQREQQEALMQMQMRGQKEMTDYNMAKQLQMWKDTSYGAQVEQMNKAGINPALLYGGGGGGGQTAGQANGSVSGAAAPSGGREVQDIMGITMQNQLLAAQKDVLVSQAEKNRADAAATAGVNTDLTKANIERAWQGLENDRNANDIQRLQKTMMNIENFEKQASQEDRLDYIELQAKIAERTLISATAGSNVDRATVDSKIKIIREEAIGAVLKNILTGAQTDKTRADTRVSNQQVSQMAQKIMIDWDTLSNQQKETRIREQLMQWQTDPNREAVNQALGTINGIISRGMMPKNEKYYEQHYEQHYY